MTTTPHDVIARQLSYEAIRDEVIDLDDARWIAGMALDALAANGWELVKLPEASRIPDAQLERIDHLLLQQILETIGWSQVGGATGLFAAWSPSEDSDEELLVPLNPEKGDYAVMLRRARNRLVHYVDAESILRILDQEQTYTTSELENR